MFFVPKSDDMFDKENCDMEEKRKRRLAALEKRDKERKEASKKISVERLIKQVKMDVTQTAKKFLGDDLEVTSSLSRIDTTVEYNASIFNTTEVFSTASTIETPEEAEKRNAVALASWVNQLLNVDKESCEDMASFSEKCKLKANEILKNALRSQKVPNETLINMNSSSIGITKKLMHWIQTINKARTYLKDCEIEEKIKEILDGNICVENLRIFSDVGMQQNVMELFLSFNPTWLRLALECIFNVDFNIRDYGSCHNIFASFIVRNVFSCPKIIQSKKYCPTGTKASITQLGVEKLQLYFIEKLLLIVAAIEYFQRIDLIIPENPPMFASHSKFQTSKDVVTWLRKMLISRKFDLAKAFTKAGISFIYEQKFYDSYTYVVQDLKTDLSDGLILGKVVETFLKVGDHSLLSTLRMPGGDRLRKLGNVKTVLKYAKDHGMDIGDVKAEDIVQGKVPKIMEMLWKIIGVFVAQKDQYGLFRRVSKRIAKESTHLPNPCSTLPDFLDGFDIILHVAKQFCQLMDLHRPKDVGDFSDGKVLAAIYNIFYVKYEGMPISKFEGKTLMEKLINIGVEELGIPSGLLTYKALTRRDFKTFELYVKVFMEKCFIVMDMEESAFVIQRFFKRILSCKNRRVVNISEYAEKWYRNQNEIKNLKHLAATQIQTAYRGYRKRKWFKDYKSKIIMVQKIVRGFLARKYTHKYKSKRINAVLIIEKTWRVYSLRKRINDAIKLRNAELEHKRLLAAQVIQCAWKCYSAKRVLKNLKNEHERRLLEERSSLVIQTIYRKYKAKQNVDRLRQIKQKCEDLSISNDTIMKDAVNLFLQRYTVTLLQDRDKIIENIRDSAALKIQSFWRGFQVRRRRVKEIREVRLKIERMKKEVEENIDLDISDLNVSIHNRFSKICEMLSSGKIMHYKKVFLELARLLRLSPSLGFFFVQVNGHIFLNNAIASLRRSPVEQEVNSLFSEILFYLIKDISCYKLMQKEIIGMSENIWHYFYAHYTNCDVVYYLGNCILILRDRGAPEQCFEKAVFYINGMKKRSANFSEKCMTILRRLHSKFF
uniref:Calponin-homology (CH) domain-containing protein n=1 Tax=Parastrongyloides trichosuri TaxID=131310 RepID=A0A0N4ZTN7_PARTI